MNDEINKVGVEAPKGESVELTDGALDNVVGGDASLVNYTQMLQAIQNAMKMINDTAKNAVSNIRS